MEQNESPQAAVIHGVEKKIEDPLSLRLLFPFKRDFDWRLHRVSNSIHLSRTDPNDFVLGTLCKEEIKGKAKRKAPTCCHW